MPHAQMHACTYTHTHALLKLISSPCYQIYAFKPNGALLSGWPRYNKLAGELNDGDADSFFGSPPLARNNMGHTRYGRWVPLGYTVVLWDTTRYGSECKSHKNKVEFLLISLSLSSINEQLRFEFGHRQYGTRALSYPFSRDESYLRGNIFLLTQDDDLLPEIVATYDNHQIQAFKNNGVAINCAAAFTNPVWTCRMSFHAVLVMAPLFGRCVRICMTFAA